MYIYDPIAIALGLPQTIDVKDYPDYDSIPKIEHSFALKPVEWTEQMRKECGDRQRHLLSTGDHYFSKNTERNMVKIKDGTHPFLDIEAQREKAKRPRKRSPKVYVAEANKERMSKGQHIQISEVTCPHCGKTGKYMIMKRWHFDNCKSYSVSSESRS